ncbi:MAG: methyltransferase domain-containing protein [Saprospiraceae bacterium]|nr:methyltransferase domain-containing protein [Saprospiraceae bacterium]
MNCRFCGLTLNHVVADLGFSPPSNSFLKIEDLNKVEKYYPLKVMVCDSCYLVQVDEFAQHDEIFSDDYVYFSSFSSSWLEHSKRYVDYISERIKLQSDSQVIEIASNDGYLLQYFKNKNIPVLGIEPTSNTANVAIEKGIPTRIEFFGINCACSLVKEGIKADLLLGNNVLAHVPDINDFVGGMKIVLKDNGTITMEFPHLLQLMDKNQFDTIYHEHFSYLSLRSVQKIFAHHGLSIYHVEEIPTHGGSLRIFAKHQDNKTIDVENSVIELLRKEENFGLQKISTYTEFQIKIEQIKNQFNKFLIEAKLENKKVAAYGAAAKGNTLLNYCGVRKDLLNFIVDASPHKQNKFIPGMHIPVVSEDKIKTEKPDYIVILPWNLKEEITGQLQYIHQWGGKFVVAIPNVQILQS